MRRRTAVLVVALLCVLVAAVTLLLPRVQTLRAEHELNTAIVEYDAAREDLDTQLDTVSAALTSCVDSGEQADSCDALRDEVGQARVFVRAGVPTGHDSSDIDSIRDRASAVRGATADLADTRAQLADMADRVATD